MPIEMQHNVLLRDHTTFKIGGPAGGFVEIENAEELEKALVQARENGLSTLVLGGGSNMLVSDDGFSGMVVKIGNRGVHIIESDNPLRPLLVMNSGERWDDVVQFAVDNKLWGLENLSRIPGRAGAFVVQNVGAYGPEAKDVVVGVTAFDRQQEKVVILRKDECQFGYRTSIFNTTEKGRYIILTTTLELSRIAIRHLEYPDLRKQFPEGSKPSQQEIRTAIKEIRDRKFPFPEESLEGNAGSFFKNVIIQESDYENVKKHFSTNLPAHLDKLESIRNKFPLAAGIKIPTAFILEACGLKGFSLGNAALNPTQPVIVLNATGNATAREILRLVKHVRDTVMSLTGLHLYTEPELIGFSEKELREFGFNDAEIIRYIA